MTYSALDWYEVKGHKVAIIHAPFAMDRSKPEIIGTTVSIDGHFYKVIAVERHMLAGPINPGEKIGLSLQPASGCEYNRVS